MSTRSLTDEEIHEARSTSWLFLALGLISIAAGVIILAKPSGSLTTLAVIAGIFVLIDGLFDLGVSLSRNTENRGLAAIMGVLSVVVGVLLIRHPIGGVLAIALLIRDLATIAVGIVRLVGAFEREHRAWNIIVALIEIAAGIVIVASPPIAFTTLALIVGIAFIASGIATCALGWTMHALSHDAAGPEFSQHGDCLGVGWRRARRDTWSRPALPLEAVAGRPTSVCSIVGAPPLAAELVVAGLLVVGAGRLLGAPLLVQDPVRRLFVGVRGVFDQSLLGLLEALALATAGLDDGAFNRIEVLFAGDAADPGGFPGRFVCLVLLPLQLLLGHLAPPVAVVDA